MDDRHGSIRSTTQREGGRAPAAAGEFSGGRGLEQGRDRRRDAGTLERWNAEILASASDDQPRRWTPAARLEAVIATAGLDETARSTWCREHGVFPTALDAWKRDAIAGLGEPADDSATAKQEKRRVKELERELRRKDKALAETAALLVLSKKLQAIFHQSEDA